MSDPDPNKPDHQIEFDTRFRWRESDYIENMKELDQIAQSGGPDTLKHLRLLRRLNSDDPLYALQDSILTLWLDAANSFIFESYQSCILTCGAIVERCLKYEYLKVRGNFPDKGNWTLGRCIKHLDWDGILDAEILNLAAQMIEPRNDRTHGLLELSDPATASFGSKRGVRFLSNRHYLIYPYRGDACELILITWAILKHLYGMPLESDSGISDGSM